MNFYLQPTEDERRDPEPSELHLENVAVEVLEQSNYNDSEERGYVSTVSGHSSRPNFYFTQHLWLIAFLYTVLGPLSDLIENLFTLFYFTEKFKNFQVLISFFAFDVANVFLVGLATLFLGSGMGLLLNTFFEIAQCVVYLNFCGYSRTSMIFLIIITIFQVVGKATKVIFTSDDSESDGIVDTTTIAAGTCYLTVMDICGWIFTLGSNAGVYSQVSFLALITTHIWAVKYLVCVASDWSAQKDRQREYKHQPPPLPSLLSNFNPYTNRAVIAVLFTYTVAFILVAFSFGVTNLEYYRLTNFADRSLCIYGIACGAVLLCFLCVISLKLMTEASVR